MSLAERMISSEIVLKTCRWAQNHKALPGVAIVPHFGVLSRPII